MPNKEDLMDEHISSKRRDQIAIIGSLILLFVFLYLGQLDADNFVTAFRWALKILAADTLLHDAIDHNLLPEKLAEKMGG